VNSNTLEYVAVRDFRTFAKLAFPGLNPGVQLDWGWSNEAIAHVLEEVEAGARLRQIINMPPRTLKSQLVSVMWTAFLLGRNPASRLMVVSYAENLAEQLSNDTRRLMQSALYRRLFPETQLERQSSQLLTTTAGGQRYATTVGGSVTGFGTDIIILDDPQSATDIYSEAAREKTKAFFQQTLSSRLNNPATGRMVLVQQRLHEDDLTGHLIEGGGWELLRLQACATEAASIPFGFGEVRDVRPGELLVPSRLTAEFLERQKRSMGSIAFEGQYQQTPVPADGEIIKRDWLRHGNPPRRDAAQRITLSLDTATKTNPANDFSVATVWLEHDGKHHLLFVWRAKVEFPELGKKVLALAQHYGVDTILIEDTGSGSALIQAMKPKGLRVIGRTCRDTKQSRLISVSSYFESGQVCLPKDAPWLAAYETELLGFPGGRHDDQVDSTTQYLRWVHEQPKGFFHYEFM